MNKKPRLNLLCWFRRGRSEVSFSKSLDLMRLEYLIFKVFGGFFGGVLGAQVQSLLIIIHCTFFAHPLELIN